MNKDVELTIQTLLEKQSAINVSSPISITEVSTGGSDRQYYRIKGKENKTIICMRYTDDRKENSLYHSISIFLRDLNINVPELYYCENGSILLEDLGDKDLCSLMVNGSESKNEQYYGQVIDQLLVLHGAGLSHIKNIPMLSKEFDSELYLWESKYFMENFIHNYLSIDLEKNFTEKLTSEFNMLAQKLSAEDRVLVHRDCQSKNILIKNEETYFIDFQGMRYGLGQYDLASLLEDPYVEVTCEFKEELIKYYYNDTKNMFADRCASGYNNWEQFYEIYNYCALQRLMQALGAYCFLGLKKSKKQYLQYVPNAVRKLKNITEKTCEFEGINELLNLVFSQGNRNLSTREEKI